MMPGSVFLIVLLAFAMWGIVRDIRRELQITKDAATPACCALCKYEATADGVARGRCPECGALYLLAGVEGAHQRVLNKLSSKSLYVWVVVLSLMLAIALAVVVGSYVDGMVSRMYSGAAATVCFVGTAMLMGAVPCWLIHARRKRVLRDLSQRMMPPEQGAST